VAYDPVTSRLVFVVDSATGKSYLPFYEEVIIWTVISTKHVGLEQSGHHQHIIEGTLFSP
jgi:hypothetical protein